MALSRLRQESYCEVSLRDMASLRLSRNFKCLELYPMIAHLHTLNSIPAT